jgi:meso-butanediol dehydrogenase/(S,S)-butanediol dehydrogenase/diacetyl reductase
VIDCAIGEALLTEGAHVCLADLDGDKVAQVAAEAASSSDLSSGSASSAQLDVRDYASVRGAIAKVAERHGRLDVKFNDAGVNKPMNFSDVTEDDWHLTMEVNGLGCLIGMRDAAKQMNAQGEGPDGMAAKIIYTASIASRQGVNHVAPYYASKWAVVSLTPSGAQDLADHGITVTGFAPAWSSPKCGRRSIAT